MPFSSKEGKSTIRAWIKPIATQINTVLDIGVGCGTYRHVLSEKRSLLSHATWIGVEVWEDYIKQFDLENRYHTIIQKDVRQLDWDAVDIVDLTIVGDILEHMTKEEAEELISIILKKSKSCIISIPIVHFPQGEEFGNPYEIHVKDDWSHDEMESTFGMYIKKFAIDGEIGVYWLEA